VSAAAAVRRRLNYQPTAYQITWPLLATEQTTAWDWHVDREVSGLNCHTLLRPIDAALSET